MKLRVLTIAAALFATGYTFVWPSVPAEALTHTCVNDPVHGIQHCAAGIPNVPFILAAYDTQHQSEWCWAASAAMIFKYYNHPLSQQKIVAAVYGAPMNWPGTPPAIEDILNTTWTDNTGAPFTVSATDVSGSDITPTVTALDAGEPIYITNSHHAMVLTGIQYDMDAAGNAYVNSARVQDPWPAGYMGYPGGSRVMYRPEFSQLLTFHAILVQ